jgi:porin
MKIRLSLLSAALCAPLFAILFTTRPAYAADGDTAPAAAPATNTAAPTAASAAAPAPTGLWDRATLFGDMGGLRPALADVGISLGLQEASEILGNATGGTQRGAAYDGLTQLGLGIDGAKAFGLTGAVFNVSALQIHGSNLSTQNLDNLQLASGIEADRATRLWELWYQQILPGNKVDLKVGQQSLDQEFMTSQYAAIFVNSAFGWPTLAASDLPAGGPAYPLSSLGVRLRAQMSDTVTVLGGVFDDNPAGTLNGDPQQANASGTRFNLHDGALFIAELQYSLNPVPSGDAANTGNATDPGLPGTYKIGIWYTTANVNDPRYDTQGLSLANPLSNGVPAQHRGDYSIYALADQMVWRPAVDSPQSVGIFARMMGAPGNRNPLDYSMDAGVVLKAPFKGRDNDLAGLGMGYAHFSGSASGLDQDLQYYSNPACPVRTGETFFELTYQYQIAPWWQIQSDLQYFVNVGGGVLDPAQPTQRIGNELVLGLRTTIAF